GKRKLIFYLPSMNEPTSNTSRPPFSQIVIYAIGQLGWSLASYGAINLLVYFYLPPETQEAALFPTYIFQGAILGVVTLLGLANSGGRIFDAITDPLIAGWSDRWESDTGKRKFFMAWAAGPMAICAFLLFYPIADGPGWINEAWLIGMLFLFYFFFTLYVVPYTALMSELGHHPEDRMRISTTISVTWALGFLMGSSAYALQGVFEASMGSTQAFQTVIMIFSIVAFILMVIPVLFLKENEYAVQEEQSISIRDSLQTVWKNQNFRIFIFSDMLYWLALTFIQLGISYYVTLLLGLEKDQASLFLLVGFVASFLLYAPINYWVRKRGKKPVMLIAYGIFALLFLILAVVDQIAFLGVALVIGLGLLSAFPLAAFGIIPNALIADLVFETKEDNGQQLSGMFYGSRNFMMKIGISLANFLFPSFLLLGKSIDNPMGVKASAMAAFAFCLLSWWIFRQYQDTETKPS
ncbi:MAG: MFS transporter, partial [Bacteroidota bacterium]